MSRSTRCAFVAVFALLALLGGALLRPTPIASMGLLVFGAAVFALGCFAGEMAHRSAPHDPEAPGDGL